MRATISGEQAYKFKHVLIREVAYSGLSKTSRADLHHAFAEWLGERAGDELLEIRAFHLDQATRLLAELDGAAPAELREEAAEALTKAGRRALSRESFRSARKLLLRAVELAPTLERRYYAGRAAWRLADFPAVLVEMEEVVTRRRSATATRSSRVARSPRSPRRCCSIAPTPITARRLVARGDRGARGCASGRPLRAATGCRRRSRAGSATHAAFETAAKAALAAAREAERKDLEAIVIHGLVTAYVIRLEIARGDAAAPARVRARRRRAEAS